MNAEEYAGIINFLYKPSVNTAEIISVPAMPFAMIDGQGDPNTSKGFQDAVGALHAVSYGIKFLPKKGAPPQGYFDHRVSALEGFWDMPPGVYYTLMNKDKFVWTLMIMQPGFVTQELFEEVRSEQAKKKGIDALRRVRFETYEEGLCCQMMHIGPYDSEPASFERMMKYCEENYYRRIEKSHHEIYMSDARRTLREKLQTIIRFKVIKDK